MALKLEKDSADKLKAMGVKKGTTEVVWTVTDASGNSSGSMTTSVYEPRTNARSPRPVRSR